MLALPSTGAGREPLAIQLAVEGVVEGGYRFTRYLTSDDAKKPSSIGRFGIATDAKGKKPTAAQAKVVKTAIDRGAAVATAVCRARDLINEPAATMTPTALAAEAQAIAKRHATVTVKVLGPTECAELGMGMFLAVGKGSDEEPRFIHMTYKPKKKPTKRIAIIGKGITFDSGGYSLKPSASMEDMKVDMSGAAAVISAMDAIATLGTSHGIHVIAAWCENMVAGHSYRLGDVWSSS